jgi:hypothetical protein
VSQDHEPDRDREDQRLARLLRAVRADADPSVWTRARARLEAREAGRAPAWLAWAMRPAALGVSLGLLAVSAATAAVLVMGARPPLPLGSADDLVEALAAEYGEGAGAASDAAPEVSPGDSAGS